MTVAMWALNGLLGIVILLLRHIQAQDREIFRDFQKRTDAEIEKLRKRVHDAAGKIAAFDQFIRFTEPGGDSPRRRSSDRDAA